MENVKRNPKVKLPARAGIWNIISGLVARGAGVVGTPIFTRLLTPEEYGLYPLYSTWLSLLTALITTGLSGAVIYRGMQKYRDDNERFISAAIGFGLTGSGIALLAVLLLGGWLSAVSGLDTSVLIALVSECALSTVIAIRSAELRYRYKYKPLAFINIFSATATPALSVLFVYLTPYRESARILGSLSAALIIALPMLTRSLRSGGRLYDKEAWRYLSHGTMPLLPHYLSSALILRVSEIVIGRVHGQAALAKYSVGISVGLALTFLTNALTQVISPWIIRKLASRCGDKIEGVVTPALKIILLASLFVMALAPEILSVITTSEYRDALPTVYPLALSVPAMLLSGLEKSAESYYERGIKSSLPTVVTAGISAVCAILILPRADYRLSALFTLGAYLILSTLSAMTFKKISGEHLVIPRKCILLFAFTAAYGVLLFAMRDVFISRLLLIIPLVPLLLNVASRVLKMIRE